MPLIRCTICNQLFDPNNSPAMPLCSERCRCIDLGRWLDERYSLPFERPELPDEPDPPAHDE